MRAYFFDSSAFVKRFAPERGSKFVLNLLHPSAKNRFYAARITEVEICAALIRRQKGRTLSADQAAKALRRLKRDFPFRLTHIAITAVQLSAALKANNERIGRGLPPLILISADTELNDAAQGEGLTVENPNNYP